ncbi:hypothetical protein CONLIGDRAFT_622068 [Coniochaeta ligniaria NRRL 30616]|uniref:Mitochondrial distribution and morphology protein 12 n=1 Tax=Coniochaeta ligniaria NRRL 30616 TaxID=1408157 RepID=A0A1J7IFA2_9PEZI|nr:hypothetical protein CONLIGDRAFT_622068 [Coniochaeta ligniaria NRRL 30616]
MSIELNWETLTAGPDGQELADRIRDFIHTKFQSVPLPRFIKSVTVHDFSFGSVPPELELKDITDPLPDFYEQSSDEEDDSDDDDDRAHSGDDEEFQVPDELKAAAERRRRAAAAGSGYGHGGHHHHPAHIHIPGRGVGRGPPLPDLGNQDMQAVFRIRYAGDVKLLLTADILLDYPMPSFVGIPVRLSITGLTFDGVGVLAKIRKRAHFCFLSPEDAIGGLLQEIRVESEIGQREGGKQSLKNVGKVERFVLEQVRRIFEEEFVYPSFWTFLV